MAAPADAVFVDGAVHALGASDRTEAALAVRNGAICRVADTYEVEFLHGIETDRIDLGGRTVLPGFYDGYADLPALGLALERADLRAVSNREGALEALRADADQDEEWILGAGYDDAGWPEGDTLDREALTAVSGNRPVAAMRVDGDAIVLNEVAAELLAESGLSVPPDGIFRGAETELVWPHVAPGSIARAREYVAAALGQAVARGVTTVAAVVRSPIVARALYELDREDELPARVRMTYWTSSTEGSTPLEALKRLGMVAGAGNPTLQLESVGVTVAGELHNPVGAFGQQEPDASFSGAPWLAPEAVVDFFERAAAAGMPVTVHVKDEPALDAVVEALQAHTVAGPRLISDVKLTDTARQAVAAAGGIVIARPNLAPSNSDGGHTQHHRFESGAHTTSGVNLALGSGGKMPAPLQATARLRKAGPAEGLGVTEALRMATGGNAAGHDRSDMGPFAVEKPADFVVLSGSPWETPLSELGVEMTVVDGKIVYRSD